MKIKRFVAQDMRQALRMVRETLGEDAVILSNKSVDGGVELTAALDLVDDAADNTLDQRIPSSARRPAADRQPTAAPAVRGDEALAAMQREMQGLRRWMQAELSGLSWYDLGQRAQHSQELFARLMALGIGADLARSLGERVRDIEDIDQAWHKALYLFAAELPVSEPALLDEGGVVALVGPTGVGKTTTIAKMAARFALRHGHRSVGLITTDSFRIGARDQLHTYARILNVPVRTATTPEEMDDALNSLGERRLVLIDTAGMSAAHERVADQLQTLATVGPSLHTLLTLAATTEPAAVHRALRLFNDFHPDACVLTKIDEAASLGAVLAALVRAGLPATFTTNGQRVPEDLQPARAHPLVTHAAELLRENPVGVDVGHLALALGGASHHAEV
ncbi:MAG: flagellar biosynthesis protein FlhF [Gammaproteobacteria bacterium]|nr:flagellar biosynthesis protein FlhF [Gammaproteobacteria bacterium]MCP5298856.1 flagellar biosynthesis protein FlhF [Chromatiaceae bacterium]